MKHGSFSQRLRWLGGGLLVGDFRCHHLSPHHVCGENTSTSTVEGCGATVSAGLKGFFCTATAVGSSDECLMGLQLGVESIIASP